MTNEERFDILKIRAEQVLNILDSLGEWNGIRGINGNGALIHDRNMNKSNINYFNKFSTLDELMKYESQHSWKDKSTKYILDQFEARIDQANKWLEKQINLGKIK